MTPIDSNVPYDAREHVASAWLRKTWICSLGRRRALCGLRLLLWCGLDSHLGDEGFVETPIGAIIDFDRVIPRLG